MKVKVGSKNKVKVAAVKEALSLYEDFADAEVKGSAVPSLVSEQPKSLEEILKGAQNRARGAFISCNMSVGIESGLMEVPRSHSGYMDVTAVVLYEGTEFYTGLSPAIELPKRVVQTALEKKIDLSEACKICGVTELGDIGSEQGFVGLFTGGRINRKDYTKYALIMAMAYRENINL